VKGSLSLCNHEWLFSLRDREFPNLSVLNSPILPTFEFLFRSPLNFSLYFSKDFLHSPVLTPWFWWSLVIWWYLPEWIVYNAPFHSLSCCRPRGLYFFLKFPPSLDSRSLFLESAPIFPNLINVLMSSLSCPPLWQRLALLSYFSAHGFVFFSSVADRSKNAFSQTVLTSDFICFNIRLSPPRNLFALSPLQRRFLVS